MKTTTKKRTAVCHFAKAERRALLTLCRFLASRLSYRFTLLLLTACGIFLTLMGKTYFAPYGIALIGLLLPSFLGGASTDSTKKENTDAPLSFLYQRHHYSPSMHFCYRCSFLLCALLLLFWHLLQHPTLSFCGLSLPLLCLVLSLAAPVLLNHLLFLYFHRRLMDGAL